MDFEAIKAEYLTNPTLEHVKEMAENHKISVRSLIGKLSKAGVYRKTEYKSKLGTSPITKLELASRIGEKLGMNTEGLEKAPKMVLVKILEKLEEEAKEAR